MGAGVEQRVDIKRFKRRVESPGVFAIKPEGKERKSQGFILMYSGHGSQQAELGRKYYEEYQFVKDFFDEAHKTLEPFGYNLKHYLLEGTEEELNRTEHAQPCIVAYNIATEMIARKEHPDLFENEPFAVGGQSLGYLNAIHRAGVLGEYGSPEALRRVMHLAYFRGQLNQMLADQMEFEQRGTGLVWRGVKGKVTDEKVEQFRNENRVLEGYFGFEPAIISSDAEVTFGADKKKIQDGILYIHSKDTVSISLPSSSLAFHTSDAQPVDKPLREGVEKMKFQNAKIRVISNTRVPAEFMIEGEDIKRELFDLGPQIVHMDEVYKLLQEHGFDDKTFHLGEKATTPKAMLRDPRVRTGLVLVSLTAVAAGAKLVIGHMLRNGEEE